MVVVVLGLVAVVTDVSALFLARRSLAATADGAALAGSQAIDEAAFYTGAPGGRLPLDAGLARAEVADYLTGARVAGSAVALTSTTVEQGRVEVTVTSRITLPFRRFLSGATGVEVSATATAESPLG
jgi:uncharacterized membrane protein